jgi:methionine-rich copper-binding protein CopC
LERSRNGKDFKVIGQVDGSGTINTTMNYTFTDNDPYLGLSFYRLSQTDFDGAFEVFPAISVVFTDKNARFSINPNPIIDQTVNLKVSRKVKNEWLTLNIIDSQGKLVEHKTFQTDYYGNVDIEFLLDKQLQKGIYIFELVSETQHEYLKVAGK